jgi:hypothetical protein
MSLVCVLVIALLVLLAFSLSGGKGKNTKFARKNTNAIVQKRPAVQSIDTSNVNEVN